MKDLAADLRRFVDENFLFGIDTEYSNGDSFLENSIIDSTGILELITHLETTYNIPISDEDLVPENFDSIIGLTRFIASKHETVQAAT